MNCMHCHAAMALAPSRVARGNGKYCSLACKNTAKSGTVTCSACGTSFHAHKNEIDKGRQYCSQFCAIKSRDNITMPERTGFVTGDGYIRVKCDGHPAASRSGHVLEHRLVVEKAIGRYLTAKEIVHHRNHVRDDNRLDNLEITDAHRHTALHFPAPVIRHCEHCGKQVVRRLRRLKGFVACSASCKAFVRHRLGLHKAHYAKTSRGQTQTQDHSS